MKLNLTLKRKSSLILITIILVTLLCSCTITKGTFIGMHSQSSDTFLKASYVKFNGSITRKVKLESGDQVTFSYQGDDGLGAVVIQDDEDILEITDGSTFTASEDGLYNFTVKGKAKDGDFNLTWEIDKTET